MLILICGDRNWNNYIVIENYLSQFPKETIVIEGGARGADSMARSAARYLGMKVIEVPAKWSEYGKSAGPIRNREMLDMGPDIVTGFHNNIEKSKGTKDCILAARKRNVPTYVYNDKGEEISGKI